MNELKNRLNALYSIPTALLLVIALLLVADQLTHRASAQGTDPAAYTEEVFDLPSSAVVCDLHGDESHVAPRDSASWETGLGFCLIGPETSYR